jgi:hypothetical protein
MSHRTPASPRLGPIAPTLALLALTALGGCDTSTRDRMANSESVFAGANPRTPVDAATDMINQYDANRRFRGTLEIANAPWGGQDVYIAVYVDHVQNDPDPGVRAIAAWALARHGRPEHAPLITPLLDPKFDRTVRFTAARSLQRLHNPEVVPALIKSTEPESEADAQVRAESAIALGQYAQTRVLQALIRATDDDSLVVNEAALQSLRTLTGQSFPADPIPWVQWLKDEREPFAKRQPFTFPAFSRDRFWYEFLPFVPPPPNEVAAQPTGYSPLAAAQEEPAPSPPAPATGTAPAESAPPAKP